GSVVEVPSRPRGRSDPPSWTAPRRTAAPRGGVVTDNEIIIGLAAIVVLGVGAQWIGRRLGFPSLLLLLPAGLVAGATGIVEPEEMFGDTLFPAVTLLVALLLFQSGLN